ncbi:MAG: hypothetical protein KGZ25_05725 [Planctomycetes bacterium]|nr:hypothetical protein [Planctomycetota bacterium]
MKNPEFHIKPRSYLIASTVLFVILAALFQFVVFGDPGCDATSLVDLGIIIGAALICALAIGFVLCAAWEVVRAIQKDMVRLQDILIGSAVALGVISVLLAAYAVVPLAVGTLEIILYGVLVVGSVIEWIRRRARKNNGNDKGEN